MPLALDLTLLLWLAVALVVLSQRLDRLEERLRRDLERRTLTKPRL